MRGIVGALIAMAVAGCVAPNIPTPSTAVTSSRPEGPSAAASGLVFEAEGRGLRLVAAFDRVEVEPGGAITVSLRLENGRDTDVVFEEPCEGPVMNVALRVPVEPVGRDHAGIAAAFKTYALEQGMGSPMESSIREPLPVPATSEPCHAPGRGPIGALPSTVIPARTAYETVLTWRAEIVAGVPAIAGPAPFTIRVLYDHVGLAGGMTHAETLAVSGSVKVLDGAASAVSAGQAVDAVIADAAFAAWLAKQPPRAWANANLFLQPAANARPLPDVPYWDVELFREPRNWAIAYVDARTGALLNVTFCDVPCDR
jgi:hypothetical protein